ncbi:hypothetical protein GCM10028785_02980 [Hydrogenophaga soli]
MKPTLTSLAKTATRWLLALLLLSLALGGWVGWDMHCVRTFCDHVQPGMPMTELVALAEQHGLDRRRVQDRGVPDDQSKDWVLLVPVQATMGDMVCAIHHDQEQVSSATVWGP